MGLWYPAHIGQENNMEAGDLKLIINQIYSEVTAYGNQLYIVSWNQALNRICPKQKKICQ